MVFYHSFYYVICIVIQFRKTKQKNLAIHFLSLYILEFCVSVFPIMYYLEIANNIKLMR
jgi:hypothetical protein